MASILLHILKIAKILSNKSETPMKIAKYLPLFTALLLSPLAAVAEIDANTLYHDYCSVCHGDKGDGNSHAKQGLVPPPRDFTTPQ